MTDFFHQLYHHLAVYLFFTFIATLLTVSFLILINLGAFFARKGWQSAREEEYIDKIELLSELNELKTYESQNDTYKQALKDVDKIINEI